MTYSGNNAIVPGFDDEKDDGLTIILERCGSDGERLTVHLHNRLDNYNAAFFQRAVEKIMLGGFKRLVFACSGLGYVSSTGIGAFTNILKDLHFMGGDMVLSRVQPRVYEVFELLGFTGFFTFVDEGSAAPKAPPRRRMRVDPSSSVARRPRVFPLAFRCPRCSARLKTAKPGKFLCSTCRTRMIVNAQGRVRAWREVPG
ncbi:MAG: STAS domain-containing protein [Rectinemataceae bacterium]